MTFDVSRGGDLQGNSAVVVDFQAAQERRLERVRRESEPWISKRELAGHLGVSTRAVEFWMSDARYLRGGRQCPFRQLWGRGSAVTFRLSEVEAWLSEPRTPNAVAPEGTQP